MKDDARVRAEYESKLSDTAYLIERIEKVTGKKVQLVDLPVVEEAVEVEVDPEPMPFPSLMSDESAAAPTPHAHRASRKVPRS
jgi:hypothetical protein